MIILSASSRGLFSRSSINLQYPYSPATLAEIEGTEAVFPFTSSVIICGDCDHLQQVIWNLLTNAIKFTPQGGNVVIRLDQITISNPKLKNHVSCGCREHQQPPFRKYAQIQVIDNGISITPNFPPYVFDRFSQAE
jgi:signal transduction histidine kinase